MVTKLKLFRSLHFNKKCWLLRHYMHNSYTLVLLRDNLVAKCLFCKIADCSIVWLPWIQKIETFELFYSLNFKTKCWLLRHNMHNSYPLVLLGDNLVGKCHFLQNCRRFHCLVAKFDLVAMVAKVRNILSYIECLFV